MLARLQAVEDRLVVADRDRERAIAVLGLGGQVELQRLDVGARGGDHREVARAGEPVDPDDARDLPLGLLHPQAARADDHVDLRDRLGAVGERGDRLRAGDAEDGVDPAQLGGGEDRRMRRGGDVDLLDARGARGDRAHHDRGRVRVPAAGRVDRGPAHGDLAQRDRLALGQRDRAVVVEARLGHGAHVGDRDLQPGAHVGVEPVERDLQRGVGDLQRRAEREPCVSAPAKRASSSSSALSPPSRTAAMIFATSSATEAPGGTSARTSAALAAASSARTQALHDGVDLRRLDPVGDRVGDQPRRRVHDLLAHDEPVLAQGRARGREVDDRVDHAGQRRELDGALDLDELDLAAGALEVLAGDPRVLGRDAHHPEPPQRLGRGILARDGREDHRARPEAEVDQLVDAALALLGQHVLAGDAQIGGAGLDVGRHVRGPHRDDPGVLEEQLAVVGAHLGGVDPEAVEGVERLLEHRPAWDGDPQAAHRPSSSRARWTRSTSSAQPQAGSSRPKRPSRSS